MLKKLLSKFRKPLPDTVQVSDRTWDKIAAAHFGLRKGMWVFVPDHGVGILTNVHSDNTVQVMLVNDDGTNKLAIFRSAFGIRQAKRAEIPYPRRPDASNGLGYT